MIILGLMLIFIGIWLMSKGYSYIGAILLMIGGYFGFKGNEKVFKKGK
jgi:uncharacterized membrane protein